MRRLPSVLKVLKRSFSSSYDTLTWLGDVFPFLFHIGYFCLKISDLLLHVGLLFLVVSHFFRIDVSFQTQCPELRQLPAENRGLTPHLTVYVALFGVDHQKQGQGCTP